ncbi:MAG: hypothetical protein VX015_09605 [Planctomycetota bacterium]|nr:hypothetical protein [Planctomycetota bacterium]
MTDRADDPRVALAESFLQEAVYRSRGDQAGATLLSAGSASCGLGEKPSVSLDLTPRAEELYEELFGGSAVDVEALRAVMTAWVKRQDALDRKRNHFLRDFRAENGADRRAYSEDLLTRYEAGLDAVNGEVGQARRAAARELLVAAEESP